MRRSPMNAPRRKAVVVAISALAAVVLGMTVAGYARSTSDGTVARAATPRTPAPPTLPRPRDFVDVVDNPYLPLVAGTRWVYRGYGEEAGERDVVTVLHRTKVIEGVTATVVHDVVKEDGEVAEDTRDWYAQDRLGNVWYLGERSREFEDGHVDTSGSWQAGVDGGRAGIVMPARPVVGRSYAQELKRGEAEDQARVIALDEQVGVPFGHFGHARVTSEGSRLEPSTAELKYYAKGVGVVAEIQTSPRFARSVLVRMTTPGGR
jgi:hypothetical protein